MHNIILILTPGTWWGNTPKTNTLRNSCSVLLLSSLPFSMDYKMINSPTFPILVINQKKIHSWWFIGSGWIQDILRVHFYQQIAGKILIHRFSSLIWYLLQNFSFKQFLCSPCSMPQWSIIDLISKQLLNIYFKKMIIALHRSCH